MVDANNDGVRDGSQSASNPYGVSESTGNRIAGRINLNSGRISGNITARTRTGSRGSTVQTSTRTSEPQTVITDDEGKGKVYVGVTEEEQLSGKLAPNSTARIDEEQTAKRNIAVARNEESNTIRNKIKAGEELTQKEQFRVLTGESATDIDSLNRAIKRTSAAPKEYHERAEGINKYQNEAKEYQEAKAEFEANQKESNKVTEKIFYSDNTSAKVTEKWAERLVKKEQETYMADRTTRFALGVEGLDIKSTDNALVKTLKSAGNLAYTLTAGVVTGTTGQSLLLTGEKALFYAYAGGTSLTDRGTREAFKESTKEQTIGFFEQATPIKIKTLVETGKIEYDPQGTVNLVFASALASVSASATIKARQSTPAKGTYKPTETKTTVTKTGKIVTEKGTAFNKYGDVLKVETKYTLNNLGKGKYTQSVSNPTGKVLRSGKGNIQQEVKYDSNTKALEYKSTVRSSFKSGAKKGTEQFKGELRNTQLGEPTNTANSIQTIKGNVKQTGSVSNKYALDKTSTVKAKGTTEIKVTESFLGKGGTIGKTKTITKTFKPKEISETTLNYKVTPEKSVPKQLLSSKKGSLAGGYQDTFNFKGTISEKTVSTPTSVIQIEPSVFVEVVPSLSQGSFISSVNSPSSPTVGLVPVTPTLVVGAGNPSLVTTNEALGYGVRPQLDINSISQNNQTAKTQELTQPISQPISQGRTKPNSIGQTTEQVISVAEYQPSVDVSTQPNVVDNVLSASAPVNPTINIPAPQIPLMLPIPLVFPSLGFGKPNKKQELLQGFRVLTKKGGKEELLSQTSFSRKEALQFGASKVGSTARASFRLVEAGSVTGEFKGKGNLSNFYKSKSGFFVEKNKFRIDTKGEVREISKKGQIAKKTKSKSKGLFGRVF